MKYIGYNENQGRLFSFFFFFSKLVFPSFKIQHLLNSVPLLGEKKINEECTETKEHLNEAGIIDILICMAEQHID